MSNNLENGKFAERVYDIDVEDPLLNVERLFAAFDAGMNV